MSFGPYYCEGKDIPTENLITLGGGGGEIASTDPEFRLSNKQPIIDIVNDFVWTTSPLSNSANTIPVLYAVELRQEQNSLISSALYYINSFFESGFTTPISNTAAKSIDWLLEKCSVTNNSKDLLTKTKEELDKITKTGADSSLLGKYLQSYIAMYITKETGFKYAFPFFDISPHNINNSWSSTAQSKNLGHNTLESSMKWIDTAASVLNIMTPGTYIEKPKYYQYPGEGESITIVLPLINTFKKGEKVPYQQNYELLWLLAYQNKPYRTSFSRILPPKLYNVSIPGIKYMPYAYISKMDVSFQGTVRQLPVQTPKGTINAAIPDAYSVTLTFTSLLADTGNLMISDGFREKVKVTER